jgi:hypothetical protein
MLTLVADLKNQVFLSSIFLHICAMKITQMMSIILAYEKASPIFTAWIGP